VLPAPKATLDAQSRVKLPSTPAPTTPACAGHGDQERGGQARPPPDPAGDGRHGERARGRADDEQRQRQARQRLAAGDLEREERAGGRARPASAASTCALTSTRSVLRWRAAVSGAGVSRAASTTPCAQRERV
jgi:hypothetical protein